ncbi:MAG: aroma-sacti cluster domain-containing protein [Acidobacteriota bacterium]
MESHVDRLEAAGVMNAQVLTDKEKSLINDLSDQEVETLINIHRKLGPLVKGRDDAQPAIPI